MGHNLKNCNGLDFARNHVGLKLGPSQSTKQNEHRPIGEQVIQCDVARDCRATSGCGAMPNFLMWSFKNFSNANRSFEFVKAIKDFFWIPLVSDKQSHMLKKSPPSQYPFRLSRTWQCQCVWLATICSKSTANKRSSLPPAPEWPLGGIISRCFFFGLGMLPSNPGSKVWHTFKNDAWHYFATLSRSCNLHVRLSLVPNSGRARRQWPRPCNARFVCDLHLQ